MVVRNTGIDYKDIDQYRPVHGTCDVLILFVFSGTSFNYMYVPEVLPEVKQSFEFVFRLVSFFGDHSNI